MSTVDPVSDAFLIDVAGISATLVGLFLVGMILYIQAGFERTERSRSVVEPYFRSSTVITFVALAIPFGVSLTLVVLPLGWSQVFFASLVVGLIAANAATIRDARACARATGLRLLSAMEVVGTAIVALMVVTPVAIGGLSPDREALVPSLLMSLSIGFLSTCVLVLTLFDIARLERAEAASS